MPFKSLQLNEQILKAITQKGYLAPTPIQAQAIPLVLKGNDILGCAQTGTGKTAAFSIPILQLLSDKNIDRNNRKRPIRSLILTPTRELAIQIEESLYAYGKFTGLSSTVVCGGFSKTKQIRNLQRGVDILVATPGRLLDLMYEFDISLRNIELFVLDEADRMLDMGFINDVEFLISKLPKKRQSLFFSATMEPAISRLASNILVNPSFIKVTPVSSTAETINQSVYFVAKANKNDLLVDVLKNEDIKSCLVFTKTKHSADKVVKMLCDNKIKADAIHGNKSQNARQDALIKFKNHAVRVLVATDIASRGIDIDHLEYVINYDVPNVPETYVHRIGRSGRAGRAGSAFSFCDNDEKSYLRAIEKLITKKVPVIDGHPFALLNSNSGKEPAKNGAPKKAGSGSGRRRSGGSGNGNSNASGQQGKPSFGASSEPKNRNDQRRRGNTSPQTRDGHSKAAKPTARPR